MPRRNIAQALLALLIVLLGISPSSAAGPEKVSSDQVATFRSQFDEIAVMLGEVANRVGATTQAAQAEQAVAALQNVSDGDLAKVIGGANLDLTELQQAVATLQQNTAQAVTPPTLPGLGRTMTAGFPDKPAVLSNCDDINHTPGFVYGFLIASVVAEGILRPAEFVCEEDILGENGSLACVPLAIIASVALGVYETAEFCLNEEAAAVGEGSYERLEHIHEDLAESVANDNENRVEIINNDNENRTQIINNDNTNRDTIIKNANANKAQSMGEVEALACEVIRLMNTPANRRSSSILACGAQPGFPYHWPKGVGGGASAAMVTSSGDSGAASSPGTRETLPLFRTSGASGAQDAQIEAPAGDDAATALLAASATAFFEAQVLDCRMLPSLYLPAEKGGSLEQVKQLVWHGIEAGDALGLSRDSSHARDAALRGDQQLTDKQYLAAYRSYCHAFQKLTPAS